MLGLWLWASTAFAQSIDQQISRLISFGQFEAAKELLDASSPDAVDSLFFLGRIQKAIQQYELAATTFREILHRNPLHLNAKRELAHTLLLMEQFGESSSQFRELLRIDDNEAMRSGYRKFLSIIERSKPAGVNFQFALMPSTNVNSGTYNTVFDSDIGEFVIDPSNQIESGLGIQLGLSGFLRHMVSAQDRLQLNWAMSGIRYNVDGYDSESAQLSLAFSHNTQNTQWNLEPFGRYTWQQDGSDRSSFGAKFALQHQVSPKDTVSLSLLQEFRSYLSSEYQSGPFSRVDVAVAHQFGSNFNAKFGIRGEIFHPQADHLQFASYSAFAGIQKAWDNGTSVALGYRHGRRNFAGDFPLTSSARMDTFSSIGLSISNSRINVAGTSPTLSCSLRTNRSNVAFFDYGVTACQIGFSREF